VLKFSSLILFVLNIFINLVTYSIRISSPVIIIFYVAGVAPPFAGWEGSPRAPELAVVCESLAFVGDLFACRLCSIFSLLFLLPASLFFGTLDEVDLFCC
jgi:hypothetical protein